MIEVKNLSKTYIDKEVKTTALKNVSFVLPDQGLVFIVGKSGSGKSTLINMLGGLDDITEGKVIFDGFDISKAKTHQLDQFRSKYLGVVYQNYNLFADETVFENVRSGADVIQKDTTEEEINSFINLVELEDKKDTLVKNLSGGQKQRVAIARALVKDPKLILADEPTGNLDTKTAKIIFTFLKKASKDRLVVVITHDMPSALEYADRILEIADGEIVRDVVRNEHINTDIKHIELAEGQKIEKEEMRELNNTLSEMNYRASFKEDRFIESKDSEVKSKEEYKTEKRKYRHLLINSLKTLKRNKTSTIITAIICMAMVGLMSIAAALTKFDSKAAIKDVIDLYNVKNLVIRKTYSETNSLSNLQKTRLLKISDAEEQLIEEKGYTGKRYPIYNVDTTHDYSQYSSRSTNGVKYESFYAECMNGVVVCDYDYLKKLFGELTIVAGSLYTVETEGRVLVPDFVADSILYFNNSLKSPDSSDPYQNIVNELVYGRNHIGAVVKTNYKEKYKVFLETIDRIKKEPQHASQLRKEITKSDLYAAFLSDANSYLNYGYSLNPDYKDYVYENFNHTYLMNCYYSLSENGPLFEIENEKKDKCFYGDDDLVGSEAMMNIAYYNETFNVNLTSPKDPNFEEKEIYITKYDNESYEGTRAIKTVKFQITKVYTAAYQGDCFRVSNELRRELRDWDTYVYGYAFDNVPQCYDLYQKLHPYMFYNYVTCFQAVFDTINIIAIFSEIFSIVLIGLIAILILIITMHNLRIIKRESYRFGVLKSMGYSSLYLAITLFIIDAITMLAIFGLSTIFSWAAGLGANRLIQLGFVQFAKSTVYLHITMVSFKFLMVLAFNGIVLLMMALTSFIPFLAIKRIKPSKIIRNAE